MTQHLATDVLIVGAGMGGCAAAWACLRQGQRVVMTEEYDWIGGQMTAQAVPPDEHPWIEQFGCTRSYRRVRDEIRQYYRHFYPLRATALRNPALNPGNGFVSAICHEPKVSLAVLEALLAPFVAGGQLRLLLRHRATAVQTSGDRVEAVTLRNLQDDDAVIVEAPYVLDATELGDLLPLARVEYVTGAEAQTETGEPHAAAVAEPQNMQAISWCFVVDYEPDRDHTIDKPASYDFWRSYVPPLDPPWGSPLLSWSATHPITLEPVIRNFDPVHPDPQRGPMDLWTFRRIADRANFEDGAYQSDIVLVNWPQIDYLPGTIIDVPAEEQQRHLEGARALSTCLFYWMQTEAPRPDGGCGWRGLRRRGDITGTEDGLARAPYIRESRRIRGLFTVREQHVATAQRLEATGKRIEEVEAEPFFDTVGVGAYRIDLHPSTGGNNYIDVSALPFQIPLGALIPQRVENLLASGKNLSVTHITNGCYRLHPVEWNVGESAGLLASFCLQQRVRPREVRENAGLLEEFQRLLRAEGVELEWPRVTPL